MEVRREKILGERKPSYSNELRVFVVLDGEFKVYLTKKGKNVYRVDPIGKRDCLRAGPDFIVGFKGSGELLSILFGKEELLGWEYFEKLKNVYED